MRLSFTLTCQAPPHLPRAEARPSSTTRVLHPTQIPAEVWRALEDAETRALFEAGGCVTITLQRAPTEMTP